MRRMTMACRAALAVAAVCVPMLAGGFWITLGNPEASAEARAMNAVVTLMPTGWVAFLHGGAESFVPAGARCLTRRESGPGIPFYRDAPAVLVEAAKRFVGMRSESALREIVDNARERDALTVWQVMTRTQGRQRALAFERFGQLVSVPAEVTSERIARGDAAAIDLCWNALGLDSAEWWRGWRRNW